jgi:hypothetical protein
MLVTQIVFIDVRIRVRPFSLYGEPVSMPFYKAVLRLPVAERDKKIDDPP